MHTLQIFHALAGFVILVEAINKLERCCPFASALPFQKRLLEILKALAWMPIAFGAAGAVVGPIFNLTDTNPNQYFNLLWVKHPSLAEVLLISGVAVMVIRTRVKEAFNV